MSRAPTINMGLAPATASQGNSPDAAGADKGGRSTESADEASRHLSWRNPPRKLPHGTAFVVFTQFSRGLSGAGEHADHSASGMSTHLPHTGQSSTIPAIAWGKETVWWH